MENNVLPHNTIKLGNVDGILEYDIDVYSVDILNAVAHFMIGKCNVVLKKVENKMHVHIVSDESNLVKHIYEFNEELINYNFYTNSMDKKFEIRKLILERVLLNVKERSRV